MSTDVTISVPKQVLLNLGVFLGALRTYAPNNTIVTHNTRLTNKITQSVHYQATTPISTIPALVAATRRILDLSPPDAQTMSERVRRRAMEYTRGRFLRRVDALMAGAMAGTLNHFVAKEQKLVSDLNGRKM